MSQSRASQSSSASALAPALDPARSAAVTASAGSGKTWLLVSRVLRLLLDGRAPGGILALTFTRKAAAEMRARINDRLRLFAYGSDAVVDEELRRLGIDPNPTVIARARSLYDELLFTPWPPRAMTLHAFCQDLLARFALEAGVAPGFELIESESALQGRAWRALLAELHTRPQAPAAEALRTLIARGWSERRLEDLVFGFFARRADWWSRVEQCEGDAVDWAVARLREALQIGDAPERFYLDSDAFTARLHIFCNHLERCGGTRWIKPERVSVVLGMSGDERLAQLIAALFKKSDGAPYSLAENDKALQKLASGERKHLLDLHAELIVSIREANERRNREDTLATTAAALRLCVAGLDTLAAELAREHALTFTEIEWHAYRLLRAPEAAEWVRYKLDQKIDHLLIDEFQDTSPTQWRLLLPLLEEMAAGDAGRARSVFIVGDAKQSIYGFRRANPGLLGTAASWLQEQLQAQTVPLDASRRSAPAIIDFVNALFSPPELGGPIGFREHATHRRDDWGRVEVAPLIEPEESAAQQQQGLRDPLTTPRRIDEEARALREGRAVAARIQALISSGVGVRGELNAARAIDYGDIIVLARKRTQLPALETALTEADIPFVGSSRGTLLETSEASDLVALLRFLDAPHRNLELAQVLRSPLFGIDDETLVRLAEATPESGCWFETLPQCAPGDTVLERALELLQGWLPLAHRLPAHDLLDRIYTEGDVAARYETALPRVAAARVRANLGAFIQLALEADSGRYPTLGRFLRYLEDFGRSAAADAPDEAPPKAERGQLRVLTIHAAKGLEAAAVFLVNAGSLTQPRTPRWLIDWPDGAPRPEQILVAADKGERDPLGEQLAQRQEDRERREELNLLYVAVTRARQFLHISGFRQLRQGERSSWHDLAMQALERLGDPAPHLPGAADDTLAFARGAAVHGEHAFTAAPLPADDARLRSSLATDTTVAPCPSASADGSDETHDPAAALHGTAVHRLLQLLATDPAMTESSLRSRLQARLQRQVTDGDFGDWLREARAVLSAPQLAHLYDPQRLRQAWNEVPVMDGERGGVIDRLVDDGAVLWIADYKTALADAAALSARYRPQLQAYADQVAKLWPARQVRAGLVLTAFGSWVDVPPTSR